MAKWIYIIDFDFLLFYLCFLPLVLTGFYGGAVGVDCRVTVYADRTRQLVTKSMKTNYSICMYIYIT